MDFVDWCHQVLQTLENERFNSHLSDHALQEILFGETAKQPGFHTSNARHGMFHAIKALSRAGLLIEERYKLRISPFGRDVLSSPIEFWTTICAQRLDSEEEKMLTVVSNASPREGKNPDHVWLEDVEAPEILAAFEVPPAPPTDNEHMRALQKYLYDLPKLLRDRNLIGFLGLAGYHVRLTPTYEGSVWATRRQLVIENSERASKLASVSKFGIPDHQAFEETLRGITSGEIPISVVFLDLDNFKSVNDTFSHKVGDEVIKATIKLVQRILGNKGLFFHRSGDEMLLLLENSSESEARAISERVRQAIEHEDYPEIGKAYVTATLGVATFPTSCTSLDALEETADITAMNAKTRKNTVLVARPVESATHS